MTIAWQNSNYAKRRVVTLDAPSGNLVDFPLLLKLEDAAGIAPGDIASKRYEIRDYADNVLDYEEEDYVESTYANFDTWARVPNLYASPSGDQNKVVVYYDYDPGTDQDNPTDVWDEYFAGVYHVDAPYTGSYEDSTSNGTDLNIYSTSPGTVDSPIAGNAVNKSSTGNGSASINNSPNSLEIAGADQQITLECFINTLNNSQSQSYTGLVARYRSSDNNRSYWLCLYASSYPRFYVSANGTSTSYAAGTTAMKHDQWHHVAGVYDDVEVNTVVDGVYDDSSPPAHTGGIYAADSDVVPTIMAVETSSNAYQGLFDEVRFSTVARPAAYFDLVHENGLGSGHAQTWGAEETKPSGFQPAWAEGVNSTIGLGA